jgi:molybdopterin converting factor subunit 1
MISSGFDRYLEYNQLMPTLHIQYFAILREQRGVAEERLTTSAATPHALYDELRARHHFTLPPDRIRAAVNDAFVDSSAPLHEGDRVVFIPPVAGG